MPRECGACLTVIDRGGAIYLLPQTVLTNHLLPTTEARGLLGELTADVRGFGPEPTDVALWLPAAAIEEGKVDVLQRLALLPLGSLEQAEALVRDRTTPDGGTR
jgi:hypothetical protein